MHLIPPDCSQEEVVVQLAHSLSAFQNETDQIFKKAALWMEKRTRRMKQLDKRMEILERKMEAVEKLPEVPLLNCASNFPEFGTPGGIVEPIFGHSAPFNRRSGVHFMEQKWKKEFNSNLLNEANVRRKDFLAQLFVKEKQRKEKVILDVETLEKLSPSSDNGDSEANSDQILARLLSVHQTDKAAKAKPTKSTQITFSDSLIDLCPPPTIGQEPLSFALGEDDPFAYEPAELGELADFDLPEDLPGIDVKSVSFVSNGSTERSSERMKKDTKRDDETLAEKTAQNNERMNVPLPPAVVAESAKESQTVESSRQILAPPPPPPPPPPPLVHQKLADVPSSSVSARSDLMAAIRASGGVKGAKLKKVEEENDGEREEEENGKRTAKGKRSREEPAEDLMSSLAKALEMRRKGMLGKGTAAIRGKAAKPKKASGEGETLALLRERIPRIEAESEESDGEGAEGERSEWID